MKGSILLTTVTSLRQDRLYIVRDNEADSYLVALDASTASTGRV